MLRTQFVLWMARKFIFVVYVVFVSFFVFSPVFFFYS